MKRNKFYLIILFIETLPFMLRET